MLERDLVAYLAERPSHGDAVGRVITAILAELGVAGRLEPIHPPAARPRPFTDYPDRLYDFGCSLEPVAGRDRLMRATGMTRELIRHPAGTGSVSLYHEYGKGAATRSFYAGVVWRAGSNMTIVSYPADSTHWVPPAPATRLIDEDRSPDPGHYQQEER